jgi:hypothetical protein
VHWVQGRLRAGILAGNRLLDKGITEASAAAAQGLPPNGRCANPPAAQTPSIAETAPEIWLADFFAALSP